MKKGNDMSMKKENSNILDKVKNTIKGSDFKTSPPKKKYEEHQLKQIEINQWLEKNGERIAREILSEEIKKLKNN